MSPTNADLTIALSGDGTMWNDATTTAVHPHTITQEVRTPNVSIDEDGITVADGTININGTDINERIEAIEKLLHIPPRDTELEQINPQLKEMYDAYMKELGKTATFKRLTDE